MKVYCFLSSFLTLADSKKPIDDQNLTWRERANIALVTDNNNKVLVRVRDVPSWVKACENRIQATKNRGRPRNVVEDKGNQRRVGLPRHESEELDVEEESPTTKEPLQKTQKRKQMWEGDNGEKQKAKKQKTKAVEERASTSPIARVLKERKQRFAVTNFRLVRKAEKARQRVESDGETEEGHNRELLGSVTRVGPPGKGRIVSKVHVEQKVEDRPKLKTKVLAAWGGDEQATKHAGIKHKRAGEIDREAGQKKHKQDI